LRFALYVDVKNLCFVIFYDLISLSEFGLWLNEEIAYRELVFHDRRIEEFR